jgi:YaiO family outer membrane protein
MRACSVAVGALCLATVGASADPAPVRLDVSVSNSSLSDGLSDWREGSIALSRAFAHGWAGAVRIEALERFGRDDLYAEVRFDRALEAASYYTAAGGAPDADFRPQAALKAGGEIALGRSADGVRLLIDGDASRFASGDVMALKLGLATHAATERWRHEARAIAVSEPGGPVLTGFALQTQAPLGGRTSLRVGYADAPETSEGVVVRVRGAHAGVVFDVADRWLVQVSGAHEDRGAYTRSEIGLGAALRF